jgi:hypothetical protein
MSDNLSKKEEIALAITTAIITSTVKGDINNSGERSRAIIAAVDTYKETLEQIGNNKKIFHL